MKDLDGICLSPDVSLQQAISCIDQGGKRVALVVEGDRRLVGLVTDGDVRRGLLQGCNLDTPVHLVMSNSPMTAHVGTAKLELLERMKAAEILHLPVVNSLGRVVELAYLPELETDARKANRVVLMAGGLGTRLRPHTERVPKPLVEVGGQPLIRTTLDMLVSQGLDRITISVNYLGDMIEDYVGDGSQFGAEVDYVREKKRMGTGGALTLLDDPPDEDFFVMNGDILTSVDLGAMMHFHRNGGAAGTMAVNKYSYQVPYGVVKMDGERVSGLQEKPLCDYFVNAGIYVLSPECLKLIPRDTFFDLPSLFDSMIAAKQTVLAFPIREYWLDVGQPQDLIRAEQEYMTIFRSPEKSMPVEAPLKAVNA